MNNRAYNKSSMIAALAALLSCSVAYAYLYFQTGSLTDDTIASRLSMANSAAARLQSAEIIGLQASTAGDLASLSGFFVPADRAVSLIQTIESIGGQSGATVSISSISASDPDASSRIGSITSAVSVRGTWHQTMKAIALFETLPYVRKLDQLSLRSEGDKDSHWHADFKLTVSTLVPVQTAK